MVLGKVICVFYLPDEIKTVLKTLESAGYEAYIVGGAVRDMLAGRPVHDYDVASSARPEDVLRVFSAFKTVKTGLKHGTVTVLSGEYPVEITVFRREAAYSDGRHPDAVSYADSITEDLSRRDFTVNAAALSLRGELVDPFGGENDIKAGIIRCVGDPEKRFSEDHLRILRALRFSSELGFTIEENTEKMIRKEKELILTVSAERIYEELCRLLEGDGAAAVLTSFCSVICLILGVEQSDRFIKTAENIGRLPENAVLRLTALLFDRDEETANKTMRKLKAKNGERERVVNAVKYANAAPESRVELKKFISTAGFQTASDVFAIRSLFDPYAEELYAETNDILSKKEPVFVKDLAVNGSDLIEAGAKQGRETGRLLEMLLVSVIEGAVENERNALIAASKAFLGKKT